MHSFRFFAVVGLLSAVWFGSFSSDAHAGGLEFGKRDACDDLAALLNRVFTEIPTNPVNSMASVELRVQALIPSRTHFGFYQQVQLVEVSSPDTQCLNRRGTVFHTDVGKLYCSFPEELNASELFFFSRQTQSCALMSQNIRTATTRGWLVAEQTPESARLVDLSTLPAAPVMASGDSVSRALEPLQIPVASTLVFGAKITRMDCGTNCFDTGPGIKIGEEIVTHKPGVAPRGPEVTFKIKVEGTHSALFPLSNPKNPFVTFNDDTFVVPPKIAILGPRPALRLYLREHPEFDVTRGTLTEQAAAITDAIIGGFPVDSEIVFTSEVRADFQRRILREVVIQRLHTATTDSEWRGTLSDARPLMNAVDKKEFLAALGGDFLTRYDFVRAAGAGPTLRHPVTFLDLLDAARTGLPAGVCRDMTSAVGQAAEQLGLEDVYMVTYQSVGLHTALIARDPEDPEKIMKLDYSDLTSTIQTGEVRSLTLQNDATLNYVISKPAGAAVAVIPSELAIVLMAETGGDVRALDFFARQVSPFIASGSMNSPSQHLHLNLLGGYLSNAGTVASGFLSGNYGNPQSSILAGEGGAGVVYQRMDSFDMEAVRIYARYTQMINTPWLRMGKLLKTRLKTTTVLQGSALGASSTSLTPTVVTAGNRVKDSRTLSGTGVSTVAAQLNFESKGGGTTIGLEAGRQYALASKDMRAENWRLITGITNLDYADVNASQHLFRRVRFWGEGAVGRRYFGSQYLVQGGFKDERSPTRLTIGYQNSINQSFPFWAPGLAPQRFVGADITIGGAVAGIEARQFIERGAPRLEWRGMLRTRW